MNKSHNEPVVDPSFRPLAPDTTAPAKCRAAITLLSLGLLVVIAETFVSLGPWIVFPGIILFMVGLVLAASCRTPGEPTDTRKLYGRQET